MPTLTNLPGVESPPLPGGWILAPLPLVATINPRGFDSPPRDDEEVSFIPMPAIEEGSGHLDLSERRPWSSVNRGYTRFQDGDVIFAKITPCMENGKIAVAHGLVGGRAAGTTELHVFRPRGGISPDYIRYFLIQDNIRKLARARMTGTAGQRRVPTQVLEELEIPLAPLHEQPRIVEAIEANFARLDAGVAALGRCKSGLSRYRELLLYTACHGKLVPTEAEVARSEGREFESADKLVTRLQEDRMSIRNSLGAKHDIVDSERLGMPREPLPEGWGWFPWVKLAGRVTVGYVGPISDEHQNEGVPLIRSQNIRAGHFDPEGMSHVSRAFHDSNQKSAARGGDLCVVRSGNVGTTCALPEELGEVNCSDLVIIQRPVAVLPRYGAYVMNSIARTRIVAGKVGIGLSHYNTKSVASLPVPVPPLSEQQRIVFEVERKLSIADEVAAEVDAKLLHATLVRQSALRCAFMGVLTPQDPSDEPASVLLERIKRERDKQPPSSNRRKKTVIAT